MNTLTLRPFEDTDIPLMEVWLCNPHVKRWYDPVGEWLEELRRRKDEFSWLNHFIVMHGEEAIGFCQFYDCFDSVSFEEWRGRTFEKRGEVFSIDYLIGEEVNLGKGFGKEIIRRLCDLVFALGAKEVVVDPDLANIPSQRALQSNGFALDSFGIFFLKHP
jgi:RimJ/RimL family protein N-acetyltransferase